MSILARKSAATALVCAVLSGGAPTAYPQANPEPRRIVLVVDEIKAIRNFPVVVAEQLGFLKGDGVIVTVMNTRNDPSTAELLMDGRVDAVMAYYHHNVVNRSAGRPSEAIVTLGVTPGAKVLVANGAKDRIRTLADLKGARIIAGGDGSAKTTLANALVLAGGHEIADYTRIANEDTERIAATLRAGGADLVVAPTPDADFYESQAVAVPFVDLTTVEGTKQYLGALFPTSTVYMLADRAAAHPEIAQHLATAFVRTLAWINSHSPEEIAAIIPREVAGPDRAAYIKVLKQAIPMFATDGRMPAEGAAYEWRVLSRFNPKYKTVAVEDTYTNRFVDVALRQSAGRQGSAQP